MKKIALLLIFILAFMTACSPKLENPQLEPMVDGEDIAIMETSMGTLKIRFFPKYAPKAVENFITHVKEGYYDGLMFHRVINNFVAQTGDPLGDGTGGESIWGEPFKDELTPSLHHIRGAVAMANSGPDSNRSQFFIVQNKKLDEIYRTDITKMLKDMNKSVTIGSKEIKKPAKKLYTEEILNAYLETGGTPFLDYDHTIFGQVYEGMETVDNFAKISTDRNDRPVIDIVIYKITMDKYSASR